MARGWKYETRFGNLMQSGCHHASGTTACGGCYALVHDVLDVLSETGDELATAALGVFTAASTSSPRPCALKTPSAAIAKRRGEPPHG